jgi:hypothetical protein
MSPEAKELLEKLSLTGEQMGKVLKMLREDYGYKEAIYEDVNKFLAVTKCLIIVLDEDNEQN